MLLNAAHRSLLRSAVVGLVLCLPAAAWALGLGPIQTDTRIGQPFSARIPIVGASANDLQGLTVGLAGPDAYKQAGLGEPDFLFDLKFAVENGPTGPYVQITSDKSVRLPFLNLLVHANWSSGEVTRQYTVLLNPPIFASGGQSSGVAAPTSEPVAARPAAAPVKTARKAPPQAQPTPVKPAVHSYGPVPRGDTLWAIAHHLRPNSSITINQMMMALYRANPDAFVGNINRLKAGYILRVPSQAAIDALGPAQATRSVARQNAEWRGGPAPGAQPAVATVSANNQSAGAGAGRAGVAGAAAASSAARGAPAQGRVVLTTPEMTTAPKVAAAGGGTARAGAAASAAGGAAGAGTGAAHSGAIAAASTRGPAKVNSELAGILGTRSAAAASAGGRKPPRGAGRANSVNTAGNVNSAPGPGATENGFSAWMTSPKGWILAGLVLVALALLLVVLRRRATGPAPATAGGTGAGDGPAPRLGESYAAPHEWREPEDDAEGDALERASRHADYGEYEEATAVLRTAVAQEPERKDLRLKLLEVLFVAGESGAFRTQAAALRDAGLVDGDGAEWEKVAGMGRQLLPEDPLFVTSRSPFDAERAPVEDATEEPQEEGSEHASPLDFDLALDQPEEPADQPEEEPLEFERIVDELSTFIETYIPGGEDRPAVEIDDGAASPGDHAGGGEPGDELQIDLEEIPSPEEANAEAESEAADEQPAAEEGEEPAQDVDPVNTKLDLARAYVDLGDPESARAMLEEVLDEGDEAQQQEARRLLDSLG